MQVVLATTAVGMSEGSKLRVSLSWEPLAAPLCPRDSEHIHQIPLAPVQVQFYGIEDEANNWYRCHSQTPLLTQPITPWCTECDSELRVMKSVGTVGYLRFQYRVNVESRQNGKSCDRNLCWSSWTITVWMNFREPYDLRMTRSYTSSAVMKTAPSASGLHPRLPRTLLKITSSARNTIPNYRIVFRTSLQQISLSTHHHSMSYLLSQPQ